MTPPRLTHPLILALLALITAAPVPAAEVPSVDIVNDHSHDGRITVKFEDEARVRLRDHRFAATAGVDLEPLSTVLSSFGGPQVERLFTRTEDEIDRDLARLRNRSGRPLADLNGYYELVTAPVRVEALVNALNELDVVQIAYVSPQPVPSPVDKPPVTPDFEAGQNYLNPAPAGIDAKVAWGRPGGRGQGITIIDIEYDWQDTHEDLESALGGKACYTPQGLDIDHGTATLGVLGAGDNGYGVTGIVPDAALKMVTSYPLNMSYSVARAIDCAASLLGPGDVMVLEAQTSGPHDRFVPVEWNQAEFDAITAATAAGIVVVEAAGNGSEDLDHPDYLGKFDRAVRDSGAIIVGAGAPAGNPDQPDRSRWEHSTYGSRVDLQGYGELVTTTGYGDLFDAGGDPDQEYTAVFGGTSGASPIVAGAVAALQGSMIGRGDEPLQPADVRRILTETGTPQQDGPYPGHIGPMPDLRRALDSIGDLVVAGVVVDDDPPLGNADGYFDPGETATVRITVHNHGDQAAQAVVGALDAPDSDFARITDREADWPDIAPGADVESLAPHHRLTLQPDVPCGAVLRFMLNLFGDPNDDLAGFYLEAGTRTATFAAADTPLGIPKSSIGGITSSVVVADDIEVADIHVTVEIAHGDISELRVILRGPTGSPVFLHDHSSPGTVDLRTTYDRDTEPDGPGTLGEFKGESGQGTWTLQVIDDVGGGTKAGTLEHWSVELTAPEPFLCEPLDCVDPLPGVVDGLFHVDPVNVDDLVFSWQPQAGSDQFRVLRSTDPEMIGATMVGQTTATTLVDSGGLTDPEPLLFYQVRAVNSCEWEGP